MVDLSQIPNVTTPIGLAAVALVCLAYIILYSIQSKRKTIGSLPEKERTRIVDQRLTRYGIQLADLPPEKREALVRLEMRNLEKSLKIRRIWAYLAWAVFFVSLVFLVLVQVRSSTAKAAASPPNPDPNDRVLYYKSQILILRGDIEAKSNILDQVLRNQGFQLADWIGEIGEDNLKPHVRIIKHEYKGWALVMAVGSFSDTPPEYIQPEDRIDYAQQAIEEFDEALRLMAAVKREYQAGSPEAKPLFEWITGSSEDLNRTHYLRAVALAVIARADGSSPRAALRELAEIKPTYLATFPAENNPDLAWALRHSKEASAVPR